MNKRTIARCGIVFAAAVCCALYSLYSGRRVRPDFDQFYGSALALRNGLDPYDVVGPGRWFDFDFRFFYPLPAALVAMPFTFATIETARATFAALSGAVAALALTRHNDFSRTPALLSFSMLTAIQYGQLAPFMLAGLAYPWLAGIVAVKPSAGSAVVAGQRNRRDATIALGVASILTIVSLVINPRWPLRWLSIAGDTAARPTVFVPVGFVLLLAALRWRKPAARWLFVFALVPVTSPMYESIPLFMSVRTFRQALILALLTHTARWVEAIASPYPAGTFTQWLRVSAVCTVCLVYVPALVWILREHDAN